MVIEFKKWQCEECQFIWYEQEGDNQELSIDHGCPNGCDNPGKNLGIMKITPQNVDCSNLEGEL